jgi:CRISPR-associated endonuclease/helicase Cas3
MKLYDYQKRVAQALRRGQNVILQAPTGAGKTLAALYPFLEVWDREVPAEFPRKCVYSVPVRVLTTQFEEAYRSTASRLGVRRPMEVKVQTGERPNDPQFEADLIFTTIDQTLSNILGVPYAVSKGKANINAGAIIASYLVFDEFHLFPPEGALMTTLQILRLLKATTPFVLMTATFSQAMLDELKGLLGAEVITVPEDELEVIETRWGWFPRRERRFHVVNNVLTAEAVLAAHRGKRRSIAICNTVKRAQELYKALRHHPDRGDAEVILLHSRFLKAHRDAKEERVRSEFGKDKAAWESKSLILVATQVIEVGLDITCEVMHTEIAPAASIIQRAGRCARFPGEEGDVYIYRVPERDDGKPNFAPYVSKTEKEICELTWKAFEDERRNGQVLDFLAEQSIIDETHTEADKELLRKMAEEEGQIWRLIEAAVGEGETAARRELIRKVDNRTLLVHDDPEELGNPYRAEGFSLWQGSLRGEWEKLEERRKALGLDWALKYPVPLEEEESRAPVRYRWLPVREKRELGESLLFAIHPALVAYDEELGFRFVESGGGLYRTEPSERRGRRGEEYGYQLESYPAHIRGMMRVYKRDLAEEMAYVFRRLAANLGVTPNALDMAVRLALALHDVGKLQDRWQRWARAYQEAIGEPLTDEEFMAVHTHWDPFDEEHEAARKEASRRVKKPDHAGVGAIAAARIVWEALNGRQHEGLYRAVLMAIARHHSPRVGKSAPFKLHLGAKGAVADALREVGEEADWSQWLIEQADAPVLSKRLLKVHDHPWQWWLLYFLIVRALRLADGRSQEGV